MDPENVVVNDEEADENQPLQFPYETLSPQYFNKCVFYSQFIVVFLNLCLSIGMIVYVAPLGNMTMEILKDSQTTINDLQVIMPEIYEGLEILHDFCRIPEFKQYCYPLELEH